MLVLNFAINLQDNKCTQTGTRCIAVLDIQVREQDRRMIPFPSSAPRHPSTTQPTGIVFVKHWKAISGGESVKVQKPTRNLIRQPL